MKTRKKLNTDKTDNKKSCSKHLYVHPGTVTSGDREVLLKQKGCVVWFTGLSGSGKSFIARSLEERLFKVGYICYVLDGDNIRHGLNSDLGFSAEDRRENIRRIGEIAALFVDSGLIVITAFISPYRADREKARRLVDDKRFFEIFVDTPLEVCEERDTKKLYQKARAGEISDFTGISAPYEAPEHPEIILDTLELSISECVDNIMKYLAASEILSKTL